ncbi:putative phosphatidate phosphatase [Orchesella cincta]|uniref:Putative phosphatidate phosphatase n=1 Tax=Orchesella cincta TaxID=48709 RepID=A0A1D2MEG7_ORCCI|nr:putative phosphatidate phosphatase [Orchesella cincta]
MAAALLSLFLLNVINPTIPALRCDGTRLLDPSISHKFRGDTVTVSKLLSVTLLFPLVQIFITEWFYNRDKRNLYIYGPPESSRWRRTLIHTSRWYRDYFFGIVFMLFLNDIAKTSVNSPRPHWIDSCKPNFTAEACNLGWVDEYNCTNNDISNWKLADARKSFPSGHSALGFFTAIFMTMYQHRRIRKQSLGPVVLVWLHTMWIGWAIFCALSRVADNRHHPIDIAFGGFIGAIGGIFTATVLCGGFGKPMKAAGYQNKVVSGMNGSATIVDGFPSNGNTTTVALPPGTNGGVRHNHHDNKRPSLRRLLSTQSTMTQMSEIAEDRELDSL